jgi:NAD(P)-dependent dehydrogenase (short-subunit alcohol dehydrogenase family)
VTNTNAKMGLSAWDILTTQYTKLPIIPTPSSINGGVYIVTGGNHGLGLECVKHLVRLTASRVILSSRSLTNGQQALAQVEKETGVKGVAEVWQLDLSNFDSVKAFADKVNKLERVDALIENASIALDTWSVAEGIEMTVAVNVVGTFLLGLLVYPKLVESGKKHGITPHLTIVGSSTAFDCAGVLEKIDGDILDGLNIETKELANR